VNRTFRRLAALLAIATLAFSQLAASAHACAGEMAMAAALEAPMPCGESMPEGNLCERHCDYGATASDSHGVSSAISAAPAVLLPWRIAATNPPAPATKAAARPFERSIERPPLIRFSVLRI
jgi:hypothetical protein